MPPLVISTKGDGLCPKSVRMEKGSSEVTWIPRTTHFALWFCSVCVRLVTQGALYKKILKSLLCKDFRHKPLLPHLSNRLFRLGRSFRESPKHHLPGQESCRYNGIHPFLSLKYPHQLHLEIEDGTLPSPGKGYGYSKCHWDRTAPSHCAVPVFSGVPEYQIFERQADIDLLEFESKNRFRQADLFAWCARCPISFAWEIRCGAYAHQADSRGG